MELCIPSQKSPQAKSKANATDYVPSLQALLYLPHGRPLRTAMLMIKIKFRRLKSLSEQISESEE